MTRPPEIANDKVRANAEEDHVGKDKADHAGPEPELTHAKEGIQLRVLLQEGKPEESVQQGHDGADGDQPPDDGQGVVAHEVQQFVGNHRNGDGQVAVLADGNHKEECTDQGRDEEFKEAGIFQNFHVCTFFNKFS